MKSGAKPDEVYLTHMLACIERVQTYCAQGEIAFRESRLIQDATLRNLQTMAESGQRLSDTTQAMVSTVPWRAIAGFRNIIVHDYLGMDVDVIWRVVADDLPPLKLGPLQLAASLRTKSGE
jgi:uncharacterized protein with HEPN domain